MQKNRGLNLELEMAHRSPTDHVFGAVEAVNGFGEGIEHEKYLPVGETQRGAEDTMDCATRWLLNAAEDKFTYAYKVGIIKGYPRQFLEDNGYVVGGRVVFADAFNAILSGTTRQGNSMIAPLSSARRDGLVPKKLLPLEKWMTFDDYHNKGRITPELIKLGREFLKIFTINYMRVNARDFSNVMSWDLLGLAGYAWPRPVLGEYPRTDGPFNHAFMGFKLPPYYIFDNYEEAPDDYTKKLAPNYALYEVGYRLIPNIRTYEITCEQVRFAYSKFKEIADAFPASNKFYSPSHPKYTIYNWAAEWGVYHHPEIFVENKLDWTVVDSSRRVEAEWLSPQVAEKKSLITKILEWLKRFFKK